MTDDATVPHLTERPATGLRIVLERESGALLHYVGQVLGPGETLDVSARVAEDGLVTVDIARTEPADLAPPRRAALAEKVRLLVRTLVRQAKADELPPPRRINRWRES